MRKVKIVATIGPATCSSGKLEELLDAGMNVARFNMSHGTPDWHRATIQRLRHLSLEKQTSLAILVDLAGPKIRVGDLPQEEKLFIRDQRVTLIARNSSVPATRQEHNIDNELPIDLPSFPQDIKSGQTVLIDDGNISLEVHTQESDRLVCTVLVGGTVTSRKGVNFPGLPLEIPGFY